MSLTPLAPIGEPPIFTRAHAEYVAARDASGGRPTADGTRGRGSKAHHCGRQLAFEDLALAPDPGPERDWNVIAFKYGQYGHDLTQAALVRHFNARTEVPVSWRPYHEMSGHVDAVYDHEVVNDTTVEIKTMKDYTFKVATGVYESRDPWSAGPQPGHLAQAGMYALAPQLRSARLHMVYINKNDGAAAEWIIPVDQPLAHLPGTPTIEQLALRELERMDLIFEQVDAGFIPERHIPGVGRIEHVGAEDRRAPWQCKFCAYRATCAGLPTGPVSVEVALRPRNEDNGSRAAKEALPLW